MIYKHKPINDAKILGKEAQLLQKKIRHEKEYKNSTNSQTLLQISDPDVHKSYVSVFSNIKNPTINVVPF